MGLLFISSVFKNLYLTILLHSFSPSHLFSPYPQPHFHKPYPQSKTFLTIRAVYSSAVFCSNVLLIKTPSSSMQFFSFFDALPSALTTTGITLMLLMFPILLISLFSSWYLSIFPFLFRSYFSRCININYATTSLILFHHSNIWFPCLDLSVTLDHTIPQNLTNLLEHVHTIFHSFSGCISHAISNELFLQHYYVFSCTPFVPTFYIRSQYGYCFIFHVTHSTKC